ncbi:hypothetical protein J6590_083764 [Homalodisca vitripennis]|nr:hypothetical protein J6590_083764 [Homalodisca vitripennis]
METISAKVSLEILCGRLNSKTYRNPKVVTDSTVSLARLSRHLHRLVTLQLEVAKPLTIGQTSVDVKCHSMTGHSNTVVNVKCHSMTGQRNTVALTDAQ